MLVCTYDLEDFFVKHKRKCLEYLIYMGGFSFVLDQFCIPDNIHVGR